MKKILMMAVALLLAMSASAYAVTRAEVREQWVEKRDGVIVEDREKTTSMMIPEYNAGILAEQKKLRRELLGDKKKNIEGAIPEIRRIFKDLTKTGEQALRDSTTAINDSAAAARENATATKTVGDKVDLIDTNVRGMNQMMGSNFWILIIAIVGATAIVLLINGFTMSRPTSQEFVMVARRFNGVDASNADILTAANRASEENAEILRVAKAIAIKVNANLGPPPTPPPTP